MNREELYYKTVNVLLDAYNNGDLFHNKCESCAVGNICKNNGNWSNLFVTNSKGNQITDISNVTKDEIDYAKILIKSTGYTQEELMKIEYIFETSLINFPHNNEIYRKYSNYYYWVKIKPKQGQFIGLTAVLNVLKEIHTTPEEIVVENQNKLVEIKNKFELV